MTGMMDEDAGLINQDVGLIHENIGLIESFTVMIGDDAGLITETDDAKHIANGRRRRNKERGKDSKPRNFPLHTMKNLPQFRNKSHEEVRQYIIEKKGVDIGGNFNWNKTIVWMLMGLAIVAGRIGIWKLLKQWSSDENIRISENLQP
ncbi:hypothetical protein K0U27_11255 [archaeon]|nr:hypothetical protein [archaeon]